MRPDIWTEELRQRIVALVAGGESMGMIAHELGVTRNAVAGQITRMRERGQMPPAEVQKPKAPRRPRRPRIVLSPHRYPRPPRPRIVIDIKPLRISFLEIGPRQCRYVLDGDRNSTEFCGLPIDRGAFCEGHAQRVYITR